MPALLRKTFESGHVGVHAVVEGTLHERPVAPRRVAQAALLGLEDELAEALDLGGRGIDTARLEPAFGAGFDGAELHGGEPGDPDRATELLGR